MDSNIEKKIADHLFSQREDEFEHTSFDREIAFYESICSGDIVLVKMLSTPLCSEGYGILSKDSLRNLKYHFSISAALIARFCIKSRMTPETSYQLSDYYIMKADECRTMEAVHKTHEEMIESYTVKMRTVRNSKIYSKNIVIAMDYISNHLHSKITLKNVADSLDLSEAYLSRLFKAETGSTFIDYVNKSKSEAAANLLRFSEYSDSDISSLLCFSSQSYFIRIFKKFIGMTPNEYKKLYHIPDFIRNDSKL